MTKAPKKTSKAKPKKKAAAKTAKGSRSAGGTLGERTFEPALCIVGDHGEVLFGLATTNRLKRQFGSAGVSEVLTAEQAASRNGPLILVRANAVIDQPLIPVLAKRPNLMLVDKTSEVPLPLAIAVHGSDAGAAMEILQGAGPSPDKLKLLVRSPEDLGVAFWKGLRKREVPFAGVATRQNIALVEWRVFMATYKGATDFVTKHVWPRPAFHVTRLLATTAVSPNMVTTVSAIFMLLAFWLFLEGYFFTGLAAAWLMTFLDTVDGKLARTTLTSSKWGNIFDHGIDLVHPPFWYAAWAYGLLKLGTEWSTDTIWMMLAIIIAGYVVQRLMEGIAIKWLGLEIHIWRPVDTLFRQVTARRNPNLVLLTVFTLFALPDWGYIAVAVWTALCLGLHGIQLVQAFSAKSKTGELASWMSAPAPPK